MHEIYSRLCVPEVHHMMLRDSRNTPKVNTVIKLKSIVLLSVSLFTWILKRELLKKLLNEASRRMHRAQAHNQLKGTSPVSPFLQIRDSREKGKEKGKKKTGPESRPKVSFLVREKIKHPQASASELQQISTLEKSRWRGINQSIGASSPIFQYSRDGSRCHHSTLGPTQT